MAQVRLKSLSGYAVSYKLRFAYRPDVLGGGEGAMLNSFIKRIRPKDDWGKKLRTKWVTVPAGGADRLRSSDLLAWEAERIAAHWQKISDSDAVSSCRGWFHTLYKEFVNRKKLLDIGCGFGISTIRFAQFGAHVTFVDIVETNVRLCERICNALGIKADFLVMQDNRSLRQLPSDYDVVTAIGSLHHAPFDFVKPEVAEIVSHLKLGGRWLQFAYPFARWEKEGSLPFSDWGKKTDGEGTPWAEPYDLEKLEKLLAPARFENVLYYEWHNQDFNWFDLKLISHA